MAVDLVNNHVLLPHAPNWREAVTWQRAWQTHVVDGATGAESRASMRTAPRRVLRWHVSPADLTDQSQLDARLRAASKSGFACAPFWGLGSKLGADVVNTAVTLASTAWTWAQGDYVFFMDAWRAWDVRQISNVAGQTLTLSAAVSRTYRAGGLCWPLLFGTLGPQSIEASTSHHGEGAIELRETISPAATPLGVYVPPAGAGIGVWKIGTTFVVS